MIRKLFGNSVSFHLKIMMIWWVTDIVRVGCATGFDHYLPSEHAVFTVTVLSKHLIWMR